MEYNISISEAFIRYCGMMAIIIISIFAGVPALALLALPLFLTAILGWCPIKSMLGIHEKKEAVGTKTMTMSRQKPEMKQAA